MELVHSLMWSRTFAPQSPSFSPLHFKRGFFPIYLDITCSNILKNSTEHESNELMIFSSLFVQEVIWPAGKCCVSLKKQVVRHTWAST